MEVELVTDDTSEDENYGLDDNNEDYLNFDGERCGICMDVVIDRGVLDCCQHWFCFACIDNWATITSLCPLCQNEFQLITCVPVYDTVGGNKTDEDTNPRDDEWFVEGKQNTLSFPSYYIDENAVVCLDGDGCRIRSGLVAFGVDSDIDTSIACDSCDKWYHAFCVGFDPDSTCDSSWLCPRCTIDKCPQRSDRVSLLSKSYQHDSELGTADCPVEDSFPRRVSVSLADYGETAVVISLDQGNHRTQESSESVLGYGIDMENVMLSSSISNTPKSEALGSKMNFVEPNSGQPVIELSQSLDNSCSSSHSALPADLKINADDGVKIAPGHLNSEMLNSGLDLDLGLSMSSGTSDVKDNDIAEHHVPGLVESNNKSEECTLPADNMVPNKIEAISLTAMSDDNEVVIGITGAKRKDTDIRNADDEDVEANVEAKFSRKKIKAEGNSQPINLTGQVAASVLDDSSSISSRSSSRDGLFKCSAGEEIGTSIIMDIVQGADRRSLKQHASKNSSDRTVGRRESAAGLRLKKIMRRSDNDKDSSTLVQELRGKIREAVRNKSSEELGKNLFDPKLLNAFRAALVVSRTENSKPALDVKAKKALLQKGKVRESLTKKIYGTGGKRRRAWTRECEVEFWKHRCNKATKPEKLQTLKSVLDVLRENSDSTNKVQFNEKEEKGSILSRLYLADTSVFPRNNDIKPVSALEAVATPGLKESGVIIPSLDGKEMNKTVKGMKPESVSSEVRQKTSLKRASDPSSGGMKMHSEKELTSKSDSIKGDKRKWALEVLARKTAASGKKVQDKEEDATILKGNYTLLAQLPKEMRPILAQSRHNKIPKTVRQAQLCRLAEHFLKRANLSVVCRTAETELAVADAVNIEKEIADRSNSKLVYVNLCSQELLRRSDSLMSDRAREANPCSTSEGLAEGACEETNNNSLDLAVDEALKNAGLADSPPNSPNHPTEDRDSSPEKIVDEGPDNVIEADSHPELNIYGDFEYNLEDDDFIGAGALKIAKPQPCSPKIKVLFSSLEPEKPNGVNHKEVTDIGALESSSSHVESKSSTGDPNVDIRIDDFGVQNSSLEDDEEPSLAECDELYGPDKYPLVEAYPEILSVTHEKMANNELPGANGSYWSKDAEKMANNELPGANGSYWSKDAEKDPGQLTEDHMGNIEVSGGLKLKVADQSKQSPSDSKMGENATEEKKAKCGTKKSENYSMVMKKVEVYIKEHIRPLCKSGVITAEQYRWAVGKTTEKVMKYHFKEKNANFLIKEGEKVKKLAEQYVEAAQQKTKT